MAAVEMKALRTEITGMDSRPKEGDRCIQRGSLCKRVEDKDQVRPDGRVESEAILWSKTTLELVEGWQRKLSLKLTKTQREATVAPELKATSKQKVGPHGACI